MSCESVDNLPLEGLNANLFTMESNQKYNSCIELIQDCLCILYSQNIFEKLTKYTYAHISVVLAINFMSFFVCFHTISANEKSEAFLAIVFCFGVIQVSFFSKIFSFLEFFPVFSCLFCLFFISMNKFIK